MRHAMMVGAGFMEIFSAHEEACEEATPHDAPHFFDASDDSAPATVDYDDDDAIFA